MLQLDDCPQMVTQWQQYAREYEVRAAHAASDSERRQLAEQAHRYARLARQMADMLAREEVRLAPPAKPYMIPQRVPDDGSPRKQCAACGQEKPLAAFSRIKRNPDGLNDRCKTCAARKRPMPEGRR